MPPACGPYPSCTALPEWNVNQNGLIFDVWSKGEKLALGKRPMLRPENWWEDGIWEFHEWWPPFPRADWENDWWLAVVKNLGAAPWTAPWWTWRCCSSFCPLLPSVRTSVSLCCGGCHQAKSVKTILEFVQPLGTIDRLWGEGKVWKLWAVYDKSSVPDMERSSHLEFPWHHDGR